MSEYVKELGNGYVLQKVYANECEGIYGDISENKDDIKKLHPGANILEGYIVLERATNLTPDVCNDWNSTIEDAVHDYEENVIPTIIKLPEDIHWFALNEEKCISLWFSPDTFFGNQFLMKLEERAEDGSMGPHCEVIIDESYGTRNLTFEALCETLHEVCEDADIKINNINDFIFNLAEEIFSAYDLSISDNEIVYIYPHASHACNFDSARIMKGTVVERVPAHVFEGFQVKETISIHITDEFYPDGSRNNVDETYTYYDSNDLYVKSFNEAQKLAMEVYEKIQFIKELPKTAEPLGQCGKDYFDVLYVSTLTDQELVLAKQLAKEFVGPQSVAVNFINREMQYRFENNVKMSLADKIHSAKSTVTNNNSKQKNVQNKELVL